MKVIKPELKPSPMQSYGFDLLESAHKQAQDTRKMDGWSFKQGDL